MRQRLSRSITIIAASMLLCALCLGLFGCGPSGTGLEDKGPPKGGPPASKRMPPGEIESKKGH